MGKSKCSCGSYQQDTFHLTTKSQPPTFNINMKSFIGLSALIGAAVAAPAADPQLLAHPYGLTYGLGLPYHGLTYGAVPISSEIKEVKVEAPEVKVEATHLLHAPLLHAPLLHHGYGLVGAPYTATLGAPLVVPGVLPVAEKKEE